MKLKINTNKTSELILKGNNQYINHMKKHLEMEHPKTRGNLLIVRRRR